VNGKVDKNFYKKQYLKQVKVCNMYKISVGMHYKECISTPANARKIMNKSLENPVKNIGKGLDHL